MENEEQQPVPVDPGQFDQPDALDAATLNQDAMFPVADAGPAPEQPAVTEQPQQEQQVEQPVEEQEEEQPQDNSDQLIPQIQNGTADIGDFARFGFEMGGSPVAGVADFAVDAVNLIPGVNIPKIPKYQNDLANGLRQLTSLIAPNVFIAGRVVKGIQGATKGYAFARTALAKWMGGAAVSAGVGAAVDYTVEFNQKDDNFLGSIKKMFPESLQWISDDWATVDGEAPDIKRAKNVREGVGLGLFTDLLSGFIMLARGIKGTKSVTEIIPESESAAAYKAGKVKRTPETPEDALEEGVKKREDALDQMGISELSEAEEAALDKPVVGMSDSFDSIDEGVRSVDGDVQDAAIDAVRVAKNIDSVYGRLGSIITEGAQRLGLKAGNMPKRQIVKLIKDQLKAADRFRAKVGGTDITYEMIDEEGTRLAEILVDPRMDRGFLKATLGEYKDELNKLTGKVKSLSDVGYNATFKAISQYLDEYVNMDMDKAAAYLLHSQAGQVSDLAEGLRYIESDEAIRRAQGMILDRLEYLMVEKGFAAYNRGASLNFLNTWKRNVGDASALREAAQTAKQDNDEFLQNIARDSKQTIDTLRTMSKERPGFLNTLVMAYEHTDGDVNTIAKLNNFVDQSLPNIGKAFYDEQPEIPNQIVQGFWANIYNSVLSAISTPIKAAQGNVGGLIAKPMATMAGAAIGGDWKTLKRGWYQYSAFTDTFKKSFKHMSFVFKKASTDPTSVGYIIRDDIALKNEQTMDVLHSFARAAEKEGNLGPLALYNMAESLHDISNNPVLRFGTNAMTALDGFTRAFVAIGEARGRVYDKYINAAGDLDGKTLAAAEDELYNSMFDKSGMITDSAVDYASREIALNLDNEAVNAIGKFMQTHTYMKPFVMFPRTSANMIAITNKYAPYSIFMKEYNKIAYDRLKNFTVDEIEGILQSKGIKVTGDRDVDMQAFENLRAEVRGRKAIGTLTMLGAGAMVMNGQLRGDGHYDKQRQRVRQDLGWKKRTYEATDGNWYSYDGMGPVSDFIALVATIGDHQDSIEENDMETTFAKLGFMLSSSLTSKSTLAGLEPMFDVLAGNPAAAARWASSWANSLGPLSGFRGELGRILSPQLREVDQEFFQLVRNRNKFLDVLDPATGLPGKYDWVDGEPVGYSENWFARGWNAIMPMKVSGRLSPERQFLIDIEFDSRPAFQKSSDGIRYTPEERSEMYNLMGKQGRFKESLQQIMQSTTAKEWKQRMIEARKRGGSIEPKYWEALYSEIEIALREAKADAEFEMSNSEELADRAYEAAYNRTNQQRGEANEFPLVNR